MHINSNANHSDRVQLINLSMIVHKVYALYFYFSNYILAKVIIIMIRSRWAIA